MNVEGTRRKKAADLPRIAFLNALGKDVVVVRSGHVNQHVQSLSIHRRLGHRAEDSTKRATAERAFASADALLGLLFLCLLRVSLCCLTLRTQRAASRLLRAALRLLTSTLRLLRSPLALRLLRSSLALRRLLTGWCRLLRRLGLLAEHQSLGERHGGCGQTGHQSSAGENHLHIALPGGPNRAKALPRLDGPIHA